MQVRNALLDIFGALGRSYRRASAARERWLGRTGSAFTWEGRLNLRNARFARDARPLDASCLFPACRQFSRAYIRHLVTQQEVLGLRLLTVHNLFFLLNLTREARDAIWSGTFAAFLDASLSRLASD